MPRKLKSTSLATTAVSDKLGYTPVSPTNTVQKDSITGAANIPSGTTSQRPSSPTGGMMRYNTDSGYFETYSASGWGSIATPPSITTISPTSYNGEQGTSFTINGSFFDSLAVVKFITSQGTEYSAGSVTYINAGQLAATTPQDFTVANEPLSVKVINGSGLNTTLSSVIDCGGTPTWNTASGSLGTIFQDKAVSYSVSASDPDASATISYSVTSGSLPSGCSLNSSTGAITGTAPAPVGTTTYSFTITATDNAGNSSARAFSITVNVYADSNAIWYAPLITNKTDVIAGSTETSGAGTLQTVGGYAGYYVSADSRLLYGGTGLSSLNGNANWTVEYWLYKTGGNGDSTLQTEVELGAGTNAYTSGLLARLSNYYFKANASPSAFTARTLNQWVHVAWVGDSGVLRHYENGVQRDAWTTSSSFSAVPDVLSIGRSNHTSGQYINATYRKFRVSNTCRYTGGTTFTPSNSFPI